jgi:hypothetical protein
MNQFPLAAISHLTAGRGQIGTSLSFHLFLVVPAMYLLFSIFSRPVLEVAE